MFETVTIAGQVRRFANATEIEALRAEEGAPHVMFACTACGHGYWTSKNIALGLSGGYNGARNIFYCGDGPECSCPNDAIRVLA